MNPTAVLARVLLLAGVIRLSAQAAPIAEFAFRDAAVCAGWRPAHDLAGLNPSAEGLRAELRGEDPYFYSPAIDLPPNQPLWLHLRLKSDQGGMGQVFYFVDHATEERSVRFSVPAGEWCETKLRLPALGPGIHLRIDPPGNSGACVFEWLRLEARTQFLSPSWPVPLAPALGPQPARLESGRLRLLHATNGLGAFTVQVSGRNMACGNSRALLGYVKDGQLRWIPFGHGSNVVARVHAMPRVQVADAQLGGTLSVQVSFPDLDGGRWEVEQTFAPGPDETIAVSTRIRVDADREVLYLPALTLLPGLGSFGTNKTQALFAGVEYLENEPSSSTADLNLPASNRQVPDLLKLTLPLMAVTAEGRYVALSWNRDQNTNVCAVFDTPDRFFSSGAQLMGLVLPGSHGDDREPDRLLPYEPFLLAANRSVTVSALIMGGEADTVVPAVQQYVRLAGLPPLPSIGGPPTDYYRLAAHGWLDSDIREGDRYRHAAPGFGLTAAADPALGMTWLADRVQDEELASRLRTAAAAALVQVPVGGRNSAQVGHIRYPLPALVFGGVAENLVASRDQAMSLLRQFEADGTVRFHARPNGLDYARTHWEPHANGLTAQVAAAVLEDAVLAGDPEIIRKGIDELRLLATKYHATVPRGAQTWEMPLHTPDILAAAHLVRAFTLGYELTGEHLFLEEARYWAWTGVPFVYLTPPTPGPIGVYSTIAVLGATSWVAPNWIGMPVQWCGLVYADALHRFARHDPSGPWKQLADGIALAGVQQTYPPGEARFHGLLPDSFNLRAQSRNGPAINPATVWVPAVRALGEPALYDFLVLRQAQLMVHAPGALALLRDTPAVSEFAVNAWPRKPSLILIHGLRGRPTVKVNGSPVPLDGANQFDAATGRLILQVPGPATLEIDQPVTPDAQHQP